MAQIDFSSWTKATGDLLPGQQRVFMDFLQTVADGDTTLVYGANVRAGSPCLVNGVQTMLSETELSPSGSFPHLVSAFDNVCGLMAKSDLSKRLGYVSPLMAVFLIRNFGEIKPMETKEWPYKNVETKPYIEPSDQAMLEFCEMLEECPPVMESKAFNDPTVDCCGRDAADCDCAKVHAD